MKKYLLLAVLLITVLVYAGTGPKGLTWVTKASSGSITSLVAADAANAIVIKHMIISIQNACNFYLLDGTTRVGPHYYHAANTTFNTLGGLPLDFRTTKGNALQIWFDTDSGAAYSFTAEKISN